MHWVDWADWSLLGMAGGGQQIDPPCSPPPPKSLAWGSAGSLGLCRVPIPQGVPSPMDPSPWGSPSPLPHPMGTTSPTYPLPWVPPAPSHGYPQPHSSHPAQHNPILLRRARAPRKNPGAQPHTGSGQQRLAVANPSTQGRSIHPQHSEGLCLSFPQLQGEDAWLGGGQAAHQAPAIAQPALQRDGSAAGGGIAVGCSGNSLAAHLEHRTARKGDYF